MTTIMGIILLCIGIGLVLIGRPRAGEDYRPFMEGIAMRQLYPALVMVFIVFGAALTLTGL